MPPSGSSVYSFYTGFVRPYLEYDEIIYDQPNNESFKQNKHAWLYVQWHYNRKDHFSHDLGLWGPYLGYKTFFGGLGSTRCFPKLSYAIKEN